MDYLWRLTDCAPGDEILLLPSPAATLLHADGGARLLGPHNGTCRLLGVDAVMSCSPNVIKAFAGHPRRFVDALVSAAEVPLLRTFQECHWSRWPLLLRDLRWSVPVTDDERQFAAVWRSVVSRTTHPESRAQRQGERLCRRYAGQAPTIIRRQLRLSAQLAADIVAGRHRSLGEFTDQSHYVRECKALTGETPGRWWRTTAKCHGPDGALITRTRPSPSRRSSSSVVDHTS